MSRPRLTVRLHLDGTGAALSCHLCGADEVVPAGPEERLAALRALVQRHSACDPLPEQREASS